MYCEASNEKAYSDKINNIIILKEDSVLDKIASQGINYMLNNERVASQVNIYIIGLDDLCAQLN